MTGPLRVQNHRPPRPSYEPKLGRVEVSMQQTTEYSKPLPVRDAENAPYYDALQRHELRLQRCPNGHFRYPVSPVCPDCLSPEFSWELVSGRGTVYSFIVVHQVYDPGFKDEVPYNVAVVELAEGPRLVTNIVGCRNEDVRVGMAVAVRYEDATPEFTLVKFAPAG
jgi:uncharacterized OB-fold protein